LHIRYGASHKWLSFNWRAAANEANAIWVTHSIWRVITSVRLPFIFLLTKISSFYFESIRWRGWNHNIVNGTWMIGRRSKRPYENIHQMECRTSRFTMAESLHWNGKPGYSNKSSLPAFAAAHLHWGLSLDWVFMTVVSKGKWWVSIKQGDHETSYCCREITIDLFCWYFSYFVGMLESLLWAAVKGSKTVVDYATCLEYQRRKPRLTKFMGSQIRIISYGTVYSI